MKRGSLPANLTITSSVYGDLELNCPRLHSVLDEMEVEAYALSWLERQFPDGSHRAWGGSIQRKVRRRNQVFDVRLWRSPGATVSFTYLVPHEHDQYRGSLETGQPVWRCGNSQCRAKITITKARELGLLPPKVSSARTA